MKSLNQRTVEFLRNQNWPLVETVEHYDHRTRRRHDLFGLFDILAIDPNGDTYAIQVTSRSNMAARGHKLIAETGLLRVLLAAGWRIWIHGWDQPGGKHHLWRVKSQEINLADL